MNYNDLGNILTSYTLPIKTNCFDFSDLSSNRMITFSYYTINSTNRPTDNYGLLISYRVSSVQYILYALDKDGIYICKYTDNNKSWNLV